MTILLNTLVYAGRATALDCNEDGINIIGCPDTALVHNTTGSEDSAYGTQALFENTTGNNNTAIGNWALQFNTMGSWNTASGDSALFSNTTGNFNTASGIDALYSNTTGGANTASGSEALLHNTTGASNTGSGANALYSNTTGIDNTASGVDILYSNTTGSNNTATGYNALYSNTTGNCNTASGDGALYSNRTGSVNTASGSEALPSNTSGSNNIGLGYNAGNNIVAGSNNIDIGGAGKGDESNTIRIGVPGTQTKIFIAGISGIGVNGTAVEVSGNGQLGVMLSSARYKRDIRTIDNASAGLMKLRPVPSAIRTTPLAPWRYGLVAEEVQRVYPNLVTYGADGKLQSVRYLEFTALLLNELQKQTTKVATQQREIDVLSRRLAAFEQQARTATPSGLRSLASK